MLFIGVTSIKKVTDLEVPLPELEALRSIYISLNGFFWKITSSQTIWDFTSESSFKPCSSKWVGLNCSCFYSDVKYNCNIIGIDLNKLGLSGYFPASFGSFQLLYSLDIGNNFIYGSIPNELSSMKKLEELDISNNYISGTIPNLSAQKSQIRGLPPAYKQQQLLSMDIMFVPRGLQWG